MKLWHFSAIIFFANCIHTTTISNYKNKTYNYSRKVKNPNCLPYKKVDPCANNSSFWNYIGLGGYRGYYYTWWYYGYYPNYYWY